jgi:hypothetical protein
VDEQELARWDGSKYSGILTRGNSCTWLHGRWGVDVVVSLAYWATPFWKRPLRLGEADGCLKELLKLGMAFGSHPLGPPISVFSQALAKRRSFLTVLTDTSRTSAVSSSVNPANEWSSTT